MPEGLATADGKPVDIPPAANVEPDADWAAHMAEAARTADTEQAPAPPKREPADPDAPFGRKQDGTPKKAPGGRPPKAKAEQPRVTAPTAAQGVKTDFTEPLTGLVQLAWGVLATTSPADAGAVKVAGPGMVAAWNALAQENAQVARGIEWLTSGSVYGAVVMATAPLVMQIMANHGRVDPARVAALGVHDPAQLAEMTRGDVQAMAAQAAA